MKKYLFLLSISVLAFTGCDQDQLEIPQKGVLPIENFYKTDDDAEAALTTVYYDSFKNFGFLPSVTGYNYGPYWGLTNYQADDIYLAGSGPDDCVAEREFHDFRYANDNCVPLAGYMAFYRSIHKCNLVINNFTEERLGVPLTATMKRCVAEARVMRAFDHMMLGIYWGTPPIVEDVLTGEARPANSESQSAVMDWVSKEIDLALADLTERQGPGDQVGAVKITKGFAYAVKGKALMWKGDYEGAKIALKAVISSNNYALVSSDEIGKLLHADGKATSEAVFEFNIVADGAVVGGWNVRERVGCNDHMTFNWRFENLNGSFLGNDTAINNNGWGWLNPTGKFAEDLIANDGMESARRKAWIKTYEEILYDHQWVTDTADDGTPLFVPGYTAKKATDVKRGVAGVNYIYGCEGYFNWKTVVHKHQGDLNPIDGGGNKNLSIMRYAEVLLLYAEACAHTNDGDGLQYLQAIQNRAQSNYVSSTLTLEDVQNEKQFELWLEGTRSADLIRWKITETLEKQDYYVPNFRDELTDKKGTEHKGYLDAATADFYVKKFGESNVGFKKGKHELLPFPRRVVELNSSIKQNPNWD